VAPSVAFAPSRWPAMAASTLRELV